MHSNHLSQWFFFCNFFWGQGGYLLSKMAQVLRHIWKNNFFKLLFTLYILCSSFIHLFYILLTLCHLAHCRETRYADWTMKLLINLLAEFKWKLITLSYFFFILVWNFCFGTREHITTTIWHQGPYSQMFHI